MKRSILKTIVILMLAFNINAQKINPIENSFPLHWSSKIGNTTYRTNVQVFKNKIYIGSNGHAYRDYYIDVDNGVQIINAKSGKRIKTIAGESWGDMDVNGVLIYNDHLYFGNDNDEFFCTDLEGNIKWRLPVSGDVEHKPTLINNNGNKYLVFATETGELRAVNPENGNTIWTYYHPKFYGWKEGESRFVFRVRSQFNSGDLFFAEPAVKDLNGDHINDFVFHCGNSEVRAINGANGKFLMKIQKKDGDTWHFGRGDYDTPIVTGSGNKIRIVIPKYKSYAGKYSYKLCYYDRRGKKVKETAYSESNGWSGGLSSVNANRKYIIPFTKSLGVYDEKTMEFSFIKNINRKTKCTYNPTCDAFSGDPLVANEAINLNGEPCVLVMFQHNRFRDKRQAVLLQIGLNSKKAINSYYLPSGSEFSPHIQDVTGDGKLDLLIGCYDGTLYCYDLGISTSQLASK